MHTELPGFTETRAFGSLMSLAEKPYDLTRSSALLEEGRLAAYRCRSRLLNLHYATQRVDDTVLVELQNLADELQLVEQFKGMRRGAVINRIVGHESENRQVLHTACRDIFDSPPAAPAATAEAEKELEKLKLFLKELEEGKLCNRNGKQFDTMIHVGIGGSDLGPRAIFEALKVYGFSNKKVFFISNVDPDDAAGVLAQVNLKTTLVNIVSKSGTTLETLTNERFVRNAFEKEGLDPADHCIAVTGEKSPMDDPDSYLRSFYMYDYIGGRFSTTSMVGAVMLGFYLGFSQMMEFLQGASVVDRESEETDIRKNISLLLALLGVWNHNFLGYSTVAILPYCQALHRFPAHLQQCDMESNGKSIDRMGKKIEVHTGPVVWGEPGTNGQHAFYQLLHQGTEIVPVEFIGFTESQYGRDTVVYGSTSQQKLLANLYGQMVAMAIGQDAVNPNRVFQGNRPSCLLIAEKLTPKVMGALLATYEAKIVFQGFAWNINSFDQEGVQLGKILATSFLEKMNQPAGDRSDLHQQFLKQFSAKI